MFGLSGIDSSSVVLGVVMCVSLVSVLMLFIMCLRMFSV